MAVLMLAGAITYFSTVDNEFSWDDRIFLSDSNLVNISNIPKVFSIDYWGLIYGSRIDGDLSPKAQYYRPLALGFLILERWAFKDAPGGFRIVHGAWHLLNVFLLFVFLSKIFRKKEKEAYLSAPVLCAALFLFLPYNMDTVMFLTAIGDLIAVSFILTASICFLSWLARPKPIWLVGVIVSSLVAALNKESAVLFPLGLALLYVLFRANGSLHKRAAVALLGSVAAVVFSLAARAMALDSFMGVPLLQTMKSLPSCLWVAIRYATVPFPMALEVPVSGEAFDLVWWFGLACLAVLGALFFFAAGRRPALSAGVGIWLIFVVPSFLAVGALGFFAPRYLYVPALGLCMAVGSIVWRPVVAYRIALLAVVGFLAFLSVDRAVTWQTSRVLWSTELSSQPESTAALINVGFSLEREGEYREAMAMLHKAGQISEREGSVCRAAMAYRGEAKIVRRLLGDKDRALGLLQKSAKLCPSDADIWAETASIHAQLGDFKKAEAAARFAQKLLPTCPDISALVAGSLAGQGKFEDALKELARARSFAANQPRRLAEIERKTALIRSMAAARSAETSVDGGLNR